MPRDESLQSIQRAVKILYGVAGVEDGCTVQQIAARTGLKPNTAYKFIRTLEREHLLRRKKNPLRFVLGQALAELKTLDDERHLLSLAGGMLVQTQALLPLASFCLLEMHHATNYERLSVLSNRPGVLVQRREFSVPLYGKASSLLFLAYCHPDEAQKLYEAHPFEREGRAIWKSRARLEDFLARVRKLGYSQPEVPDSEGSVFRVAAPVFSRGQELIAAIGGFVPIGASKKYRAQLVRLCRKTAAELTERLRETEAASSVLAASPNP